MKNPIASLVLDKRPLSRGLLVGAALLLLASMAVLFFMDEPLAPLLITGGVLGSVVAIYLLGKPLLLLFVALFFREMHFNDPVLLFTYVLQAVANGALVLALCAWAFQVFSQNRRILWNPVLSFMALFMLWSGVTLLWAGDVGIGVDSLRRFVAGEIMLFLMIQNVNEPAAFDKLMRVIELLAWSTILLGFHAVFFTEFQIGERLKVPGFNENEFGSKLILLLPGVVWAVIRSSDAKRPLAIFLAVLYAILALILVLLSGSRGSTLSFAITMATLCLWKPLRFWGVAGGGLAIVLLVASAPFLLESLNKRFEEDNNELGHRDILWEGSMRLLADHPLTGVGLGNGPLELPRYAGIGLVNRVDMPPHNFLFEVGIETGLLGLFLYLGILGSALYQFARSFAQSLRPESAGLIHPGYFYVILASAAGYLVALLKDGGAFQPGTILLISLLIIPSQIFSGSRGDPSR